MENEQRRGGFTKVPNDILEHLGLFHPYLSQLDEEVIYLTIRFTYGYQRKYSSISINKFARHITTTRSNIGRAIQNLINRNIIKVIAENDRTHSRVLQFNENYHEWDLECKDEVSSGTGQEVSSGIGQGVSSGIGQEVSSQTGHIYINKNKKKNKESINYNSSCSSIINIISPEEMKKKDDPAAAAAILKELDKRLKQLYISCFGYSPNVYELSLIKKEITEDDRLMPLEIMKIVQDSFHKVATYAENKRNANYVTGVIKSLKQEILLKNEKQKKEKEKREYEQKQQANHEEYRPGYFLDMLKKGRC